MQARRKNINGSDHFCGAAIIQPDVLITAAHCTFGHLPSHFVVRVGAERRKSRGFLMNVKRIVNHPKFKNGSLGYDISLLQLEKDIEMKKDFIEIIEIAPKDYKLRAGALTFATGWGSVNSSVDANQLQGVYLPVINQKKCKENDPYIQDDMLCAGSMSGGIGTCFGETKY